MASTDYHIVSEWRVDGTVDEVAAILADGPGWGRWWPASFIAVTDLTPGRTFAGRAVDVHAKGWLPHTVRMRATVAECDYPRRCVIAVTGDLEGSATCSLRQYGPTVRVRFDWNIRVRKPLLVALSWALKPLFRGNHTWTMRRGRESLLLELARRRTGGRSGLSRASADPPQPTFPHGRGIPGRATMARVASRIPRLIPATPSTLARLAAVLAATAPAAAAADGFPQYPAPASVEAGSYVAHDGASVPYQRAGSGSPTLVFVHGWAGRPSDWDRQLAAFSRQHEVILPDLRPVPASAAEHATWSVEHLGGELANLLQAHSDAPLVLVGHEIGGLIAAEAASRLGPRVHALVGVETFVHVRNPMSRAQQRSVLKALRNDFNAAAQDFAASDPDATAAIRSRVLSNLGDLDPVSATELLEAAFAYDLGPRLMVVVGDVTTINSAANPPIVSALRVVDPDFAAITLADLGPVPFIEDPDRFNAAIRELVDSARQPTS